MKIFKNIVFIFLIVFFISCTEYNEPAPFFDGLFLRYHEVFGDPKDKEKILWTREIEYQFKELKNGNFHIIQKVKTQRGKALDKGIEPVPYPEAGENLTIDREGKVVKGGDFMNFVKGYPSYFWLPPEKRKDGGEIIEGIWKVKGRVRWRSCNALLVEGILKDKRYYDINTGILLGVENATGKLKMILVDTNLETLKLCLDKNRNKYRGG